MTPPMRVTLVHGTFARGTPWTLPESDLHKALLQHFPDAIIDNFEWSGINSVFGRRFASADLVRHLYATGLDPKQRHYIVAHSHGGNVAIEAMIPLQGMAQFGVCCLATPFFHANPRDVAGLGGRPFLWGFSGLSITAAALANAVFYDVDAKWLITSPIIGLGVFASLFFDAGVSGMGEQAKYYSDQVRSVVPPGLNLRILRVSGDEASLVLALGQLITWLSNRLFMEILRRFKFSIFVSPLRRKWFLAGAVASALVLAALLASAQPGDVFVAFGRAIGLFYPIRIVSLVGAVCLIGAITRVYDRLLLGLSLIGVLIASAVVSYLVGTRDDASVVQGAIKAFCIDIDAEAAPAGDWQVTQFSKLDRPAGVPFELVHSIYNDERVRNEVIAWIEESERRARPAESA